MASVAARKERACEGKTGIGTHFQGIKSRGNGHCADKVLGT
jgi:hypothetical protein